MITRGSRCLARAPAIGGDPGGARKVRARRPVSLPPTRPPSTRGNLYNLYVAVDSTTAPSAGTPGHILRFEGVAPSAPVFGSPVTAGLRATSF